MTGVHGFVSLPREVRAVRWTGENLAEVRALAGDAVHEPSLPRLVLPGPRSAKVGDWIVVEEDRLVGVYPPEVFQRDYSPLDGFWCEGCGEPVLIDDEARSVDEEGGVWHEACTVVEPLGGAA